MENNKPLSDEALERIRLNKERAMELKRAKQQQQQQQQLVQVGEGKAADAEEFFNSLEIPGNIAVSSSTETIHRCIQEISSVGQCGRLLTSADLEPLFTVFGELCCSKCKSQTNKFDLLTKDATKKEYLLPIDTVNTMRFIERVNPRNISGKSFFGSMKLILRKDAEEKAIKRWGSKEALESEKKRRLSAKLSRDMQSTSELFDNSIERIESLGSSSSNNNSSSSSNERLSLPTKRKESPEESLNENNETRPRPKAQKKSTKDFLKFIDSVFSD